MQEDIKDNTNVKKCGILLCNKVINVIIIF